MEPTRPQADEVTKRIDDAFTRMRLLGTAAPGLREMVSSVIESTEDANLRNRLADELQLAADENEELLAHLRQVHIANGERLDGARSSNTVIEAAADSAATALGRARKGLLSLAGELRALRRWSKYRFAWEDKLIRRRFPPAPTHRTPPPGFTAAFAQLDTAINERRRAMLKISEDEANWSLRLLRSREFSILGWWWKSSRSWIAYSALRHAISIVLAVAVGVFLVNAITQGMEYLWGCAVSLFLLIVQSFVVSPWLQRRLAGMRMKALGDGAINWAHARIFAAVSTTAVELSWRRVRDEEQRIPPDHFSGVAI